jgi:hypothetical protein
MFEPPSFLLSARVAKLVNAPDSRSGSSGSSSLLTGTMDENKFFKINCILRNLPVEHAQHWCGSEACACMGCANRSGKLASHGFTKDDWLEWWKESAERIGKIHKKP